MKNRHRIIYFIGIVAFFISVNIYSQIKLSPLFSDNMVLQQQSATPIWGKATPNGKIKVTTSWNNKNYELEADAVGDWKVIVETPKAGGPHEISITQKTTVKLNNVMIGEVWICSGQSNMEMQLAGWGKVNNYEKEIATANYPNIRLLQLQKATNMVPQTDIKAMGNGWLQCSPQAIAEFSATAYFFGRNIHINQNIPIGLIHTSWGGTPAESWTSLESLEMMPEYNKTVKQIKEIPQNKEAREAREAMFRKKQDERSREIISKDFGYEANVAVASAINYNDAEWKNMNLPELWEVNSLPLFDGIVWFRKTIDIPSNWAGKNLNLNLGMIDDNDITYFNGVEIGQTEGAGVQREYVIPKRLVKKGKAVITVRVTDTGGGGGFHGERENLYIAYGSQKNDLATSWKYKAAVAMKDISPSPQMYPNNSLHLSNLFNAMIHPLIPYKIKGAIWYQGESNDTRAYQYRTLFPLMINDWRTKWGYNFPFYFVQLANFKPTKDEPSESDWAELREAQLGALHLANTGMIVATDLGDATDIHPKNKQDIGSRLALIARAKEYGENIVYSGPIYSSYSIDGNKIRIKFEHTANGIEPKGGQPLAGFTIAGPDRKFYKAEAQIEGNEVVVYCNATPFPVAVRYAWADNPVCNLYNSAGLPASPFRTDDWPGITFYELK